MKIKRLIFTILTCALASGAAIHSEDNMENTGLKGSVPAGSVYDFTVKGIDGKDVSLKDYSGKVLLIVNTASRCGFTPQYKALEALQKKYQDQGFTVLGFPSNDFGGQEPGTSEEIKSFCDLNYQVTFPLFQKGPVSGKDIQPFFEYLTKTANPDFGGRVMWNFEKFVIDREGKLIERYRSITAPDNKKVIKVLEAALQQPAPAN